MKKLIVFLALSSLFLAACSVSPASEEMAELGQTSLLTLGADPVVEVLPLEASFMSDYQTMVYTFNYDGNLIKMLDAQFDGASEYGASFKVEGGAEIVTSTYLIDDFDKPKDGMSGECRLTHETVEHEQEVLMIRSSVCMGQDAALAGEAMGQLVDGVVLKAL